WQAALLLRAAAGAAGAADSDHRGRLLHALPRRGVAVRAAGAAAGVRLDGTARLRWGVPLAGAADLTAGPGAGGAARPLPPGVAAGDRAGLSAVRPDPLRRPQRSARLRRLPWRVAGVGQGAVGLHGRPDRDAGVRPAAVRAQTGDDPARSSLAAEPGVHRL